MDIHDYKKRLEKIENKIIQSNMGEKNRKIIFDYEKQMFIKEFSLARIERCISIIAIVCEKLNKDLDLLEKEEIEEFLEWVQQIGHDIHINRFLRLFLRSETKIIYQT